MTTHRRAGATLTDSVPPRASRRTRRFAARLLVTTLALTAVPSVAFAATGTPSSGEQPVVAEDRSDLELAAEAHALKAHNDQRAAGNTRKGVSYNDVGTAPRMTGYSDIMTVSRKWADHIDLETFFHNPDYSQQYGHWSGAGENIAVTTIQLASAGTPSQAQVVEATDRLMQSWWNSEGHRVNWMNPIWDHFAVGASVRVSTWESGGNREYWTLSLVTNFRRHDGSNIPDAIAFPANGSTPPNETDVTERSGWGTTPPEGAMPFVGDWDGDGDQEPGWYHRGQVALSMDNGSALTFRYGRPGDVPIVGDWDGDGIDTLSVIRDGTWHLNNRHAGGNAYRSFVYGRLTRGDLPLVGDWDGDGRDGIGIVRDGEWHLRNDQSGGPGRIVFVYGRVLRGDVPVIGDWDGDGADTVGIVRGSEWHLRDELAGGRADQVVDYGRPDDQAVVGDFDGDGVTTTGIVRGASWFLRNDLRGGSAHRTVHFGM